MPTSCPQSFCRSATRALLLWAGLLGVSAPAPAARSGEERPLAVRSIDFVGNEEVSRDRLLGAMRLAEATFLKRTAGLERIEFDPLAYQIDVRAIRYFYQQQGFIHADVKGDRAAFDSLAGAVDLTIRVTEGNRYRFERVTVEGAARLEPEVLWKRIGTRPGDLANLHQVKRDANAIRTLYRNRGYVRATVEFETAIREGDWTVDVRFDVSEGEPHTIAKVVTRGNLDTRDEIVLREMRMKPGKLYNRETILTDERNLYNTGLFSGVKVSETALDSTKNTVNLRVELIERSPRWISFAVGSSTGERENVRLSADWGHKNLAGTARLVTVRAEATWQLSRYYDEGRIDPLASRFEFAYLQPWIFGHRLSAGGTAFTAQEIPVGREDRLSTWGIVGRLLRRIGTDTEVYLEATLQWANESVEGRILDRDISQTKSVTLAHRLDSRANVFAPTSGTATTIALTHAGGVLGGDFDFRRATASYARFFGLGEGSVAALRLSGGAAAPFGESEEIPIDQVFTAGGSSTVRGYLEGGLGAPGTPEEGGRVLALVNLELRQRLVGDFGVAPFIDGAQVWPYLSAVDAIGEMRWSMGTELRYQTPIGPLRVGYGVKMNPESGDPDPGSWFFGFGQVF
ncbi:MAG: hypothetical protein CME06_09935 [Gemmatimonadetes bacterium]|nr:hypothetical protein [Gemmatimonadota bacterium]